MNALAKVLNYFILSNEPMRVWQINEALLGGIDVPRLNFKLCHVPISEGSDVAVAISSMPCRSS